MSISAGASGDESGSVPVSGTFYTAWELGIVGGASGSGWLLAGTDSATVLLLGAVAPVLGPCSPSGRGGQASAGAEETEEGDAHDMK